MPCFQPFFQFFRFFLLWPFLFRFSKVFVGPFSYSMLNILPEDDMILNGWLV